MVEPVETISSKTLKVSTGSTNVETKPPHQMPEISRFLGIVISMYHNEHNPPHFHAEYGDFIISVEIESGKTQGAFPPRAKAAVLEWLGLHKEELLQDWQLATEKKKLKKIKPLE